jgi:hypothetical protein
VNARWHQDSDRWIWRVYDGLDGRDAVTSTGENTTDIYIVPRNDGWWIIDAQALMDKGEPEDWIVEVNNGGGVPIAGPFADEQHAKAAWRLMYD